MQYNPALDGMRALAVSVVVAEHCGVPLANAQAGVEAFFVLSGFLITTLLLERGDGLGRFYLNRAIRLCPPLFLLLIAYAATAPALFPNEDAAWNVFVAAFYFTDMERALGSGGPSALAHTWSLAVEEHYYLLWPLIIPLFARLKRSTAACLLFGLFIAACVWRGINLMAWGDLRGAYYRFDTRASGLILGSALAFLPWRPSAPNIGLVALAALAFVSMATDTAPLGWIVVGYTITEILAAYLVLSLDRQQTILSRALSWRPLVYIGQLSYAIYLWNFPISLLAIDRFDPTMTLLIVAPLSIGIAALSYEFIERPLKVLRHRESRPAYTATGV